MRLSVLHVLRLLAGIRGRDCLEYVKNVKR
jgi:hypothetical protein